MLFACSAGFSNCTRQSPGTTCNSLNSSEPTFWFRSFPQYDLSSAAIARFAAVLFFLPLFLFSAHAQTQTTGAVQGVVLEESTNAPVQSVIVFLTNEETGLERSTLTDSSGRYFIGLLPVGLYTLRGQKEGFTES